ncbi:hypothetical protein EV195_1186 [Tenacibaculum skagerrakense]|uniref:Uncharacterized protein n=1 Tax=Tenacibaculum skagerrakense TaxID=186571 RepID=A0A4R2NJB0_9FLAO|nr:hypothetical protein EV195_1186 [Tenacibaculum skagerrakense]
MKINLIVIRTSNPEILKIQYEKLGFEFDYHKHGKRLISLSSRTKWICF